MNYSFNRCRAAAVSLLLLLACTVLGNDWTPLREGLQKANSPQVAEAVLSDFWESHPKLEDQFAGSFDQGLKPEGSTKYTDSEKLLRLRNLAVALETGSQSTSSASASELAASIKKDSAYNVAPKQQSNWLSISARAMWERINDFFKRTRPNFNRGGDGNFPAWLSILGMVAYYVVIALLVLAVIVFAFYMFRFIQKRAATAKRAKSGLLDDLEEIKTEDEYLAEADAMIAEGKYREAIRALYLACLLKIDVARITRFDRSETNWEHLRRIESSLTRPADFTFREQTKTFDRVWYGFDIRGMDDVELFRSTYLQLQQIVTEASK